MEMLYRYDVIVYGLVQCIVTIYAVLCERVSWYIVWYIRGIIIVILCDI